MESLSHFPSVSVLIPARNAADGLRTALPAILNQEYAKPVEILVADGSDTEDTAKMIRQLYPSVRLVPNPGRTISEGINKALTVATGEVIVRCDAYATLPPGYIRRAVETLNRTGAVNVGGQQLTVGHSFVERSMALAQSTPIGVGDAHYRLGGSDGPTDTVYLGVFRREALEAVGRFDPTLLRNEDYALNWRIRMTGGMVWYDSGLVVSYRPRSSLRALARQYFDYGRWKCVVARRYPRSLRWRHVVAPLLTLGLGASVAGALTGVPLLLAFALPLIYLLTLVGETIRVGIRRRDPAAVFLPLTLMLMHLSWGTGFFCPPRSLRKESGAHIRHPFLEERTLRTLKPSFPEHEGGTPADPMIGQTNAGGQRVAVRSGTASVAEAGQGVSVIVLTWNSAGKIEPCLESLGQGTQVPDEIIVVDNGSTDQTLAVLSRQFPSVSVIENPHNRGVARARNQGLAAARGEYLLVLDDDTVVLPDALARLASVLDTNPTVAVCGPQLLDSARQPMCLDLPFPTLWHKVRRWGNTSLQNGRASGNGLSDGMRDVDYLIGACQLIRRAALDEVGPYDEHVFYGPEDIDFCVRLHSSGWRVVCQPAAQVIHAEQRIARSVLSEIGRKHVFGLAYYFWKHRYGLSRKRLSARLPT